MLNADLNITSLSIRRCLGVRQNTVWLKRPQGRLKVIRVGGHVFHARKCRVVCELDAADSKVVTSQHCRPVAVVLDLFLVVTVQIQKVEEVVCVEADVAQTTDEVLLTSQTWQLCITPIRASQTKLRKTDGWRHGLSRVAFIYCSRQSQEVASREKLFQVMCWFCKYQSGRWHSLHCGGIPQYVLTVPDSGFWHRWWNGQFVVSIFSHESG